MNDGRSFRGKAAAMAVTVLVLLVGFAWVGPPAHACSCARNVPSLREYFDASDLAVEGHVTGQRFDLGGPGPFDDFRVYTFAVDRVVKGIVGSTFELKTGIDGGNCGGTIPIGPIGIVGTLAIDGSMGVGTCRQSVLAVEQIRALEGGLPAPDGSGPPAALVTMQFGDATMASTDSLGRVIRYGTDPDIGETLAACPGGATVLALRRPSTIGEEAELQTIDVASVRVQARFTISGLQAPESGLGYERVAAMDCLEPLGRVAIFEKIRVSSSGPPDYHSTETKSVVIEHDGVITQAIEGVESPTYDVSRNRVIAFRDGPPATVVAIDIGADGAPGAVRDLVVLPDSNRPELTPISPDRRRVAVPHLVNDPVTGPPTVDQMELFDLDTGERTDTIAVASHPDVASMRWLTATTFLATDFQHAPTMFDVTATVLPSPPGRTVWWTFVGQRFWGPGTDRPGHWALEMSPIYGGASQYGLAGATVQTVVALRPTVFVAVIPAPPIVTSPTFTG